MKNVDVDADSVWQPLSCMKTVSPMQYGAVGDGIADDTAALSAASTALAASGGIIYFPRGKTFVKMGAWAITQAHLKLWAPNRQATLLAKTGNVTGKQATMFDGVPGGVFGLAIDSDATTRLNALSDHQVVFNVAAGPCEVCGVEIKNSNAVGVFLYGSNGTFVEGNYIHHTYADHIHHTNVAYNCSTWGNWIYNVPGRGDDGVACVSYGHASPLNHDLETWGNVVIAGTTRGFSCVGGQRVNIHDNVAYSCGAAGILVSEESGFDSGQSIDVQVTRNVAVNCGLTVGHPGILVSSQNPPAGPITSVAVDSNVAYSNLNGNYGTNGTLVNVTNTNLATSSDFLPRKLPLVTDAVTADTDVLRTRDVSHVDALYQPGLYRIHVQTLDDGATFQQRFEYVVKGPVTNTRSFLTKCVSQGHYLSACRIVDGLAYAVLLTSTPIALGLNVQPCTFANMRAGDQSGRLSWLWRLVDAGVY